jgi:hypothetical protein
MFHWYRRSRMCLVYLDDVLSSSSSLEDQLSRSRWFTRAWTLQELLAPSACNFYDAIWTRISSKSDLIYHIAQVTNIDFNYLNGRKNIHKASIAERLQWVSRRETTRPEDIAYSLLGIFDTIMPLLYGEGGLKAFQRLQLEIINSLPPDQSLFDWDWDETVPDTWTSILAPSPLVFRSFHRENSRVFSDKRWLGAAADRTSGNFRILSALRAAGYTLPAFGGLLELAERPSSSDLTIVDAARATSAAPYYFRPLKLHPRSSPRYFPETGEMVAKTEGHQSCCFRRGNRC